MLIDNRHFLLTLALFGLLDFTILIKFPRLERERKVLGETEDFIYDITDLGGNVLLEEEKQALDGYGKPNRKSMNCPKTVDEFNEETGIIKDSKCIRSERHLIGPILKFTISLFQTLTIGPSKNVIVSPVSIHRALSILLLGAGEGSETEEELLHALNYDLTKQDPVTSALRAYRCLNVYFKSTVPRRQTQYKLPSVGIYNLGILGNEISEEFREELERFHLPSVIGTDEKTDIYKLLDKVNNWAIEAGCESDLLKVEDLVRFDNLSLLILSAIKVETQWFSKFSTYKNILTFYNNGRHDQQVANFTSISQRELDANYIEFTKRIASHEFAPNTAQKYSYHKLSELEFRAIKIKLTGPISLTIFEPLRNGTGDELRFLESQLLKTGSGTPNNLVDVLNLVDSYEAMTSFRSYEMPMLNLESNDLHLNKALETMGISSIFDYKSCNLSRITSEPIKVSDVKHNAFIRLDENGLSTTRPTLVKATHLVGIKSLIQILVQTPFMFIIRFRKIPLFIGHVLKV